eukprot:g20504.t1
MCRIASVYLDVGAQDGVLELTTPAIASREDAYFRPETILASPTAWATIAAILKCTQETSNQLFIEDRTTSNSEDEATTMAASLATLTRPQRLEVLVSTHRMDAPTLRTWIQDRLDRRSTRLAVHYLSTGAPMSPTAPSPLERDTRRLAPPPLPMTVEEHIEAAMVRHDRAPGPADPSHSYNRSTGLQPHPGPDAVDGARPPPLLNLEDGTRYKLTLSSRASRGAYKIPSRITDEMNEQFRTTGIMGQGEEVRRLIQDQKDQKAPALGAYFTRFQQRDEIFPDMNTDEAKRLQDQEFTIGLSQARQPSLGKERRTPNGLVGVGSAKSRTRETSGRDCQPNESSDPRDRHLSLRILPLNQAYPSLFHAAPPAQCFYLFFNGSPSVSAPSIKSGFFRLLAPLQHPVPMPDPPDAQPFQYTTIPLLITSPSRCKSYAVQEKLQGWTTRNSQMSPEMILPDGSMFLQF